MLSIRPATVLDVDDLVWIDLEDEGVTSGYRNDWGDVEKAAHRHFIASFVSAPDKGALVVDAEGSTVGAILWRYRDARVESFAEESVFRELASVLPADGEFAEIFQLWIAPAFRRQGLATALKSAVEDHARARGVSMVYTHTEEIHSHVLDLNKKLGYREVRRGPIWDDVVRVSLVKSLK